MYFQWMHPPIEASRFASSLELCLLSLVLYLDKGLFQIWWQLLVAEFFSCHLENGYEVFMSEVKLSVN